MKIREKKRLRREFIRKATPVVTFIFLSSLVGAEAYYAIKPEPEPIEYVECYIKPAPKSNSIPEVEVMETAVHEPITKVIPVKEESNQLAVSDSEIDLLALVTMAEAEGEPEYGKRLVIDTILNRVDSDRFADTISGVVYASGAFECMWNGRIDRCYVRDDIRQLVIEELQSRTRDDVHYFRAGYYHNFGIPVTQIGNHYFSTY